MMNIQSITSIGLRQSKTRQTGWLLGCASYFTPPTLIHSSFPKHRRSRCLRAGSCSTSSPHAIGFWRAVAVVSSM